MVVVVVEGIAFCGVGLAAIAERRVVKGCFFGKEELVAGELICSGVSLERGEKRQGCDGHRRGAILIIGLMDMVSR